MFPSAAMRTPALTVPLRTASLGAALAALAAALSWVLARHPPSLGLVLAIGLGLVGVLALALARFEVAVGFGVLLLAVVRFEPAPTDAIFAVVIAVALSTGRFGLRRVPLLAVGLVGTFLAINLFASVEMIDVAHGVTFFAVTLYLGVFALWLTGYVQSNRRARLVVRLYLLAALASAAIGSLALFVSFPGHETFVFGGDRAQGLFKDPVVYGPFLVPAALILMEEIVAPRLLGGGRSIKAIGVSLLVLGTAFSFSRAAWLNLALGLATMLVVLALRRGGGRQAVVIFAAVLSVAAISFAAIALTGSVGFLEQRAHLQTYDAERFGAQAFGIRQGERYPLGIGPGQFDVVSPVSAHSTYIRAFAEEGAPGLLVLVALLLATLVLAAGNAARGSHTYGIGSAALLGSWVGILANGLFVDTLHWRHLWLLAALIWAGSMRSYRADASSRTGSRSRLPR
jgi:hypothetical protein